MDMMWLRTHGEGSRRHGCEVAGLCVATLLIVGGCRDAPNDDDDTASVSRAGPAIAFPDLQLKDATTFVSADVCGTCHQAIHATWQQSMHSRAWRNGVFQASYRMATQRYSKERARMCLNCHAPTVWETQDYAAENPITNEGVTCDFCHSIRSVNLDAPGKKVDLEIGKSKYGPLKHAQSPAHKVVDSDLHRSSELCAVCHEYRNEHGVPILETYSEWMASAYAEQGTQCQDCHMPLVTGRVAAMGTKTLPQDHVNLHDISGSHDIEQVRKAVSMEIVSIERLSNMNVRVVLSVTNVGSGHRFPTGLPTHRAVLDVVLTDRGRQVGRRTVEFAKILIDTEGVVITDETEMFFEARSIHSDTRIQPGEKRTTLLTFYDVHAPEGLIEASLSYQYSTHRVARRGDAEVIEPTEMKFLLASEKRALPVTTR